MLVAPLEYPNGFIYVHSTVLLIVLSPAMRHTFKLTLEKKSGGERPQGYCWMTRDGDQGVLARGWHQRKGKAHQPRSLRTKESEIIISHGVSPSLTMAARKAIRPASLYRLLDGT